MRTLETTFPKEDKAGIRWKRVVLAGFLSEIAVIAVLSAVIGAYSLVIAPGRPDSEYNQFAELAGYYLAAPAAALATFGFAFWTVRRLESRAVANGLLVGTVAMLLSSGFILGAKPEHRLMYVVSFALRILAGYCSGVLAQKMKGAPQGDYARQVR